MVLIVKYLEELNLMPITYPLSLPTQFKSAEITFNTTNLVAVWEGPYDMSEQTYEFPGKRITATIKFPKMNQANGEELIGWLMSLHGRAGTFYLNDTSKRYARGIASGTPVVNGTQTALTTDLYTRGWTASVTGILLAGDWIQVGTGSSVRLHKVLSDVNSDSSGHATLSVWPNLRTAYADGTTLVTTNASGIFRLKEDTSWTIDNSRIYTVNPITAVESVSLV